VARVGGYPMGKNFRDLIPTENKNVLLVDALNFCFRWKDSSKKDFSQEFVNTVRSLAGSYACSNIIICADKGSSSYRKEISPEYKGNREDLKAAQSEEEKEKFQQFFLGYEEALATCESLNIPVARYDRVEADDIIAFISKYKKKMGYDKVWIISSDKDLDLLVNEDVSRFSHITRKETTSDTWDTFYEFPQEMFITYKCLTGDKGDNVSGVMGIGPKRATQIIAEYGDVFDIVDRIPIPSKYKYIQALNDFGEQLLTNLQLMDLLTYCEEALGEDNCADLLERFSHG